jgi:hypothetical protein
MAEQLHDSRLDLQHSQGALSRHQHFDDAPLDHAVAEPSCVELWLTSRSGLDRPV